MPTTTARPQDTLLSIAQQQLGNSSQWRAIADLNPNLNVLQSLPVGQVLDVPQRAIELAGKAQPILSTVATALTGIDGQLANTILNVSDRLTGYTDEAKKLLAEVNGVLDGSNVESVINDAIEGTSLREYKGQISRLVDWLL
ncbi:MAG TPA: LysM peptidoglycan-binding domain-containing protein [Coleofasciculaceae cyanobacterium]